MIYYLDMSGLRISPLYANLIKIPIKYSDLLNFGRRSIRFWDIPWTNLDFDHFFAYSGNILKDGTIHDKWQLLKYLCFEGHFGKKIQNWVFWRAEIFRKNYVFLSKLSSEKWKWSSFRSCFQNSFKKADSIQFSMVWKFSKSWNFQKMTIFGQNWHLKEWT